MADKTIRFILRLVNYVTIFRQNSLKYFWCTKFYFYVFINVSEAWLIRM
jgi:hypothetical protein